MVFAFLHSLMLYFITSFMGKINRFYVDTFQHFQADAPSEQGNQFMFSWRMNFTLLKRRIRAARGRSHGFNGKTRRFCFLANNKIENKI
ncbi:MAG: hypothetical protein D3925_03020 [Candidatus Electrothrix sp. AR5]|nr:hypothetical protein [Candidatus Electrothrix sp. AR5]